MNKKLIPFAALALFATVAVTSCGSAKYEKGVDLNYVLLIGQIDHNDSAARTRGIREALGTRDLEHKKVNPNAEKAVQGKLEINGKTYRINELEAMEQKNTAGATWDQQTATSTAQNWINKYSSTTWKTADGTKKSQGITFFVSNNDGMAEGAIGADNWVSGMPIWGYDSNSTTLEFIKEGKIMGTVNQNAPGQAAAIYMVARNAIDKLAPAEVTKKGFTEKGDWGKLNSDYQFHDDSKALLAMNVGVTKENVNDFTASMEVQAEAQGVEKKADAGAKAKIFHSYYSNGDTFLNSSMKPLFKVFKDKFNFDVTEFGGDGNDEALCLNALDSAENMDAYILNMVKTTSTSLYLDKIAAKTGATEEKPTEVPVIFWNRQGTNDDGSVDTAAMQDKRFKYIYYVGFDANQGGDIQGQMIVDYIKANIDTLTK